MTDREKLIELIRQEVVPYFAERIADRLIANGLTFETDTNVGGKWIPVTERFPEKTRVPKDVLVYHKLGNCGMYVDRAWYDSDRNKWRSALSMNMKVTHWMPMPEPPKEN
jgi:hypothetical protein